jgi:WD40 repeat protein
MAALRLLLVLLLLAPLAAGAARPSGQPATGVAFGGRGLLITGCLTGPIRLWSVPQGKPRGTLASKPDVRLLAVDPRGKLLASVSQNGSLRVLDLKRRQEVGGLPQPQGEPSCLAWSPDGTRLAVAADQVVTLIDLGRRQVLRQVPGIAVAWNPDGGKLALGTQEGQALVIEVPSGRRRAVFQAARGYVASRVAWSPDGRTLAVGTGDRRVLLYDLKLAALRRELTGHQAALSDLAWSPDGKLLASAALEAGIRLWEPDSGRLVALLQRHRAAVLCLAFSPDGTFLASGGYDGMACLWSRQGKLLAALAVGR